MLRSAGCLLSTGLLTTAQCSEWSQFDPKPTSREDRVSVPARPTATWGTAMRRQCTKNVIQLAPTGREKPLHLLQETSGENGFDK